MERYRDDEPKLRLCAADDNSTSCNQNVMSPIFYNLMRELHNWASLNSAERASEIMGFTVRSIYRVWALYTRASYVTAISVPLIDTGADYSEPVTCLKMNMKHNRLAAFSTTLGTYE